MPARKNKKTIPVVLVAVLIGIAFAAYLKSTDLTEDVSMFRKTEWHGNLYSVNPDQAWAESAKRRLRGIDLQASDPANAKVHASGGIQKLYGGDVPEIVVLGDSHALMWGKVLDEIASELSVSIAFYSTDGIPPFFEIPPVRASRSVPYFTAEEKLDFDRAILASIGSWKPRVVVVVARWDIQDIEMAGQLVKYIGNIGCKVLLIEQPPVLYFGDRNAPQYLSYSNVAPQLGAKRHIDIMADPERYQD